MKVKILTDVKIIKITSILQKVYFVLICFLIFGFFLDAIRTISGLSEGLHREKSHQGIITILLYLAIYIGLRRRNKWLIPLVIYLSTWFSLSMLLYTLKPAVDVTGLVEKIVGFIMIMFCIYQIHFFSKHEVKAHYGSKGKILF